MIIKTNIFSRILKTTTVGVALAVGVFIGEANKIEASTSDISRIMGDNRFETAATISSETYAEAEVVLLANAREFADALAGVPLAYQLNAPILIAQGNRLNDAIATEINRLNAKEVIILGGEQAVSTNIEGELEELGLKTSRLSGSNRFETAEIIADELNSYHQSDSAVLVDGFEFADAMSIAPFAAKEGMPIYLTRSNNLMNEESLEAYKQIYIVGGENAVSASVEERLNDRAFRLEGSNRYETNMEVLNHFSYDTDKVMLATGMDFADALTGSVLAAKENTGIALVRGSLSNGLKRYSFYRSIKDYVILGGESAVNQNFQNELKLYLDGEPIGFIHPNEGEHDYRRFEELVLEHVNELRASHGVAPLSLNNDLSKAASIRAFESSDSFSHRRPDGSQFVDVLADYNIPYNHSTLGENLALGPQHITLEDTARGTFFIWSTSQGHRDNMLNSSYNEIGIGYYNINRRVYASQIFGSQ